MRRAFAAALLLASAPLSAQTPPELAGVYDGGQTEMAAALELTADGRFRYMLSYGAADEHAAGTWNAKDGVVYLTTSPAVVPPRFVVEKDEPAPAGALYVSVAKTGYDWGTPLSVLVRVAGEERPYMTSADESGRVELDPKWRVTGITPAVPVYEIVPEIYAIEPGSGHRLRFRFEPNDIGRADFRRTALRREDGALVLERWGRTIRFRPMETVDQADIEDAVTDVRPD
jgi:hypothetical protein